MVTSADSRPEPSEHLPGWAISAAAEALGFDPHWPIHTVVDWLAIASKAQDLLDQGAHPPST